MRRSGLLVFALLAFVAAPTGQALPERAAGDVTGTITPGGPPVTVTTTSPGDNVRLTFEGTVGQRVAVGVTNVSLSPAGSGETVQLLKPDQTSIGSTGAISSSGWIDTKTLDVAGTYTVFVDPIGNATGSTTLTLYEVPADLSSAIAIGAGPVTVTINNPGQNAELPFSGAQGQKVRILRVAEHDHGDEREDSKPGRVAAFELGFGRNVVRDADGDAADRGSVQGGRRPV